jgi:hypothetical protein
MMKRTVAFGVLVAAITACGGAVDTLDGGGGGGVEENGATAITGTVLGRSVPNADAIGLYGTTVQDTSAIAYAGVIVTNVSNTCGFLGRKINPANAAAFGVEVEQAAASATGVAPIAPGTYAVTANPIPPGPLATVHYMVQDAHCASTASEQASSGTVTLTRVDSHVVSGTFDAAFPNGDHVGGSFSVPVCDGNIFAPNMTCGS